MQVGHPPFTAEDPLSIYKRVAKGDLHLPSFLDGPTRSLLRNLLTADTTRRYGCLKGGAADVTNHRFFDGFDWRGLVSKKLPPPFVPPRSYQADDPKLWVHSVQQQQVSSVGKLFSTDDGPPTVQPDRQVIELQKRLSGEKKVVSLRLGAAESDAFAAW